MNGFLGDLRWHSCRVVLRCLYAKQAREHPLSVFEAILRSSIRDDLALFHPEKALACLKDEASYGLTLVFPHAGAAGAEACIESVACWLADPRHHFALEHRGPVLERSLDALAGEHKELVAALTDAICVDFMTPFPFKASDKAHRRRISGEEFGRLLLRRAERLFGPVPEDERIRLLRPWEKARILTSLWNYAEYRHEAKSMNGTQYIKGYMGPLVLSGNLAEILPLLLLCSELHAGRRLHFGQGAYRLAPPDPFSRMMEACSCGEERQRLAAETLKGAARDMLPSGDGGEPSFILPWDALEAAAPDDAPPVLRELFSAPDACAAKELFSQKPLVQAFSHCRIRLHLAPVIQACGRQDWPVFFTESGLCIGASTEAERVREGVDELMGCAGFAGFRSGWLFEKAGGEEVQLIREGRHGLPGPY